MPDFVILLTIAGALAIGAISPGPSFVLVSRVAVTASRPNGLAAALGMGVGGATFGMLALAGLSALLQQVEWLHLALKIGGGLYLVYLGIRIWRSATTPLVVDDMAEGRKRSAARSFWLGLVTQLSNPKTAIYYASIFAALLPAKPAQGLLFALPPTIFLIEAGWYAIVALAFSSSGPRAAYLRSKTWVDRVAGAVLGALGARLLVDGLPSRAT
ncbi:LysE family transporter [Rhizobium sp. TH2]|uniref:LysE family translocator n=1 Tax=Rhizobium sp. TH2 TaxID=2775403 RepID=UPI002156FBBF|nr:LysE family transporter [Rhizobium sp. TH2]UVC07011.1 LysE family transporter [Rhizobium sp. TH2]